MLPTAFDYNGRRYDVEYTFVDFGERMVVVRFTDDDGHIHRNVWSERVFKRRLGQERERS